MAGHNKWSKIKHRKAVVDKRRGKVWTKCSKALIVAAKHGGPDPDTNLALRYAIDEARYANMPRETIERAIKKGAGGEDTSNFENVRYEGYGPGGAAVIVDALTDNRTRTAGDVRNAFAKYSGNLGSSGCVAFMFESKGRIIISPKTDEDDKAARRRGGPAGPGITTDEMMELLINAGAADVIEPESAEDAWVVFTAPTEFPAVKHAIEEGLKPTRLEISDAALDMIPSSNVAMSGEQAEEMRKLLDSLEDNDDVQKVYSNADLPDEE